MQPTPNQVHVNRILTSIAVRYAQNHSNFIASKVFPVVPVDKQTDSYFTYTKNDWFRDEAQQRAPSTESAGSGYGVSTASYGCDVFAFHKDVDDQTMNNADIPLDMERDATEFVTQRLLLRQEIQWATDYFTTSVWATDLTPSSLWSDYTNSDPISDVETGKLTVLSTTGFMPNTLTLGYQAWIKLKNHPDLVQRIQYGGTPGSPAIVNQQTVAAVFGLERVLVAMAVKATNKEGETAAYSFVQGKHALLTYSAGAPSILQPSAGYTFMWKGVSHGLGDTLAVKSIPMPLTESTRYEGQVAFDNKVVATDLGYFFNGAVS